MRHGATGVVRRTTARLLALGGICCAVAACGQGGSEAGRESAAAEAQPRLVKILAIDGGGARGLIPALVLEAIEERTGRPIHELFDVVAGTSTGSLITAMLTVPKPASDAIRTASEIVSFYEGEGARRFFERDADYAQRASTYEIPSYPASSHVAGIQGAISSTAMLSEARTHVAITAYNLTETPPRTYTFTRWKARHGRDDSARGDHEFPMWEVIRAASTFPGIWPGAALTSASGRTYYPLDGGMFAINPVLEGLAHAIRLLTRMNLHGDDYRFLVVSLGTGFFNQTDLAGRKTEQWGAVQWFHSGSVPPAVEVLFEGQTDSVDGLMREIAGPDNRVRYYHRFQPRMSADFKLDDVDPESLAELRGYAEEMLSARAAEIESICELLGRGRVLPDR